MLKFDNHLEEMVNDFICERIDGVKNDDIEYETESETERVDALKYRCYQRGFHDALQIAGLLK
ncbi:MAG: hypothetical protein IJQ47_02045 [Synergistaceae bacterium]|nr:hypothetical protein [Synergistaceae bacterium]